jgi:hypothetical protein
VLPRPQQKAIAHVGILVEYVVAVNSAMAIG